MHLRICCLGFGLVSGITSYLDVTVADASRCDSRVGQMLDRLEQAGELGNTVVIIDPDNGMAFPRAKANCYELGIHSLLAVHWGNDIPAGRTIDDLVGFVDVTGTVYQATGVNIPEQPAPVGKGFLDLFVSYKSGVFGPTRTAVCAAREPHSYSRYRFLGYPERCIRTHDFLYIRKFTPERWPARPSRKFNRVIYDLNQQIISNELGPPDGACHDIDACPTLGYMIENQHDVFVNRFLQLSVGKRPTEGLFHIRDDPAYLHNCDVDLSYADVKTELADRLIRYLPETGNPRVTADWGIWDMYPCVARMRWFPCPDWADRTLQLISQFKIGWRRADRLKVAAANGYLTDSAPLRKE